MRPPAGSARRRAATCSFSRRSSASASNSSLRARRYSLDSPGKWTFGSRSTSRHLFMSRGLPLRAIVSILSYAPNSLPCGVGPRSVVSCTAAFCGATQSAVEHREEGVEAFRQQRVREDRIRHVGSQRAPLGSRSTLCRAAPRYIGLRVGEILAAVLNVRSLSGQGPEPFPHRVG